MKVFWDYYTVCAHTYIENLILDFNPCGDYAKRAYWNEKTAAKMAIIAASMLYDLR